VCTCAAAVTGPRTKWFRPGWGWFTPEVVDTAQKLGYHTVLGSVWPWDVYSKCPLLNALYISAKVYPGAVVVLHDRWVNVLRQAAWLRRTERT
jgi:peptidoglycan/xylan/chitin deacetylase (PgdA/CDA1 family)